MIADSGRKQSERLASVPIRHSRSALNNFGVRVLRKGFNNERPHQALDMKCPAEVYTSSCRPYQGIGEPHYPFHDKTVVITNCGRLCLYRKKINLSTCLAGQVVGIKEVDDGIWLVTYEPLRHIRREQDVIEPETGVPDRAKLPSPNSVQMRTGRNR